MGTSWALLKSDSQLVLHWLVGVTNDHFTVQEGQLVLLLTGELDVLDNSINMLCEGHILELDLHTGVIHTVKPVAGHCTWEGVQGSALHLLHVQVKHNRVDWGDHGTTVKTFPLNEMFRHTSS